MALEVLADDIAHLVVVLQCLDLFDLAECVKGIVVEVIYSFHVGVRDDDPGQALHVPEAMCDAVVACVSFDVSR